MSQYSLSPANLRSLAQALDKDRPAVMQAVQAIIEGMPLGQSSLDDKVVGTWEGVTITERMLRDDRLPVNGQFLRRHREGGGWVPLEQDEHDESMPFVSEDSYVGPWARVTGTSLVTGNSRVTDNSRVIDSRVHNSQVDNSQVYTSQVYTSQVTDSSWVINSGVIDSGVYNSQVMGEVLNNTVRH